MDKPAVTLGDVTAALPVIYRSQSGHNSHTAPTRVSAGQDMPSAPAGWPWFLLHVHKGRGIGGSRSGPHKTSQPIERICICFIHNINQGWGSVWTECGGHSDLGALLRTVEHAKVMS